MQFLRAPRFVSNGESPGDSYDPETSHAAAKF
ncbi:MAG: hypothetical protein JWQ94_3176 [Tardiphaga sp.]|jgi:hypothetical protein|nr:hypothetical protein [Tardiphaga sp.]